MSKSIVATISCSRCFKYGGHRVSSNGNVLLHCFNCKLDSEWDGATGQRIFRPFMPIGGRGALQDSIDAAANSLEDKSKI